MTTPLGRYVMLGDWTAYRQDLVLKVLHDFKFNPFNPEELALDERTLAAAMNVPPPELPGLCQPLVARGLVEVVGASALRITDAGVQVVLSLLNHPLQAVP